eukprot:m.37692 g.37692  ORF g.37692 m.37692 type:complete len:87 (-) comp9857_c0_seq1:1028-1288(-)
MDRDDLLFSIHLAHVAGRYDDMLLFLKRLIHMGFEFHDPERELLHAAFAGLVGTKANQTNSLTPTTTTLECVCACSSSFQTIPTFP